MFTLSRKGKRYGHRIAFQKSFIITIKSIITERSQNKKTKCNFFENEVATSQDGKMKLSESKTQYIVFERRLVQHNSVYIFVALKFITFRWSMIYHNEYFVTDSFFVEFNVVSCD